MDTNNCNTIIGSKFLFLCQDNILANDDVTVVEFCNTTIEDFTTILSLHHNTDK